MVKSITVGVDGRGNRPHLRDLQNALVESTEGVEVNAKSFLKNYKKSEDLED